MPFDRRDYAGGAVQTTLVGTITALSTTWAIDDATGWPDGTNGKFGAVFDRGGPNEEKVLCTSLVGTTISLAGASDRGADETSSKAHAAPETFEHCYLAIDADEANLAVSQTVGQVSAKGDLLVGKSANRFQRVPIGSANSLTIADPTQPGGIRWGSIPTGGINSTTQFAINTVPNSALIDDTITYLKQFPRPYSHFSSTTGVAIPDDGVWHGITTFGTAGTLDEDTLVLLDAGRGIKIPDSTDLDDRWWEISAGFRFGAGTGGRRLGRFNCSTAGMLRFAFAGGEVNATLIGTRVVRLRANETCRPELLQDSGGPIPLAADDDLHFMQARLLQ